MNVSRPLILGSVLALVGCASTPEAPRKEFKAVGEVRFAQSGASLSSSFSDDRVVSTSADLSLTSDGSWRGRIGPSIVDVNVYPNRLAGSGLTLNREQVDGREVYTAQANGKIFRFEIDQTKILIRAPHVSSTFGRNPDGTFGPGGILKLTGEASVLPGKWPHLALSLLAAFADSVGGAGHNMN